ncbi:MAG: hypothetical protein PVF70_00520 [Anaerolineales bacterium]
MGDRLLEAVDFSLPLLGILPPREANRELQGFMADLGILFESQISLTSTDMNPTEAVEQAGLVVLAGGDSLHWLEALDRTALEESLLRQLGGGGMVLALGAPGAALGSWILPAEGEKIKIGLGWMPGGIVLPGIGDPSTLPQVLELLVSKIRSYALGLLPETALAVGPEGEVEVWSSMPPTLMLGKGWSAE